LAEQWRTSRRTNDYAQYVWVNGRKPETKVAFDEGSLHEHPQQKGSCGLAWWHRSVILDLETKVKGCKFEASLSYIARLCLKTSKKVAGGKL
jgi:hypothetical protein